MDVYFYNLNKRKNSTKVPTGTGDKKTVKLKDNTDFDNPVFIMNSNVTGYNYASWNGAYYFIVGRKYIGNELFEITMEVDALATHASEIKASTQYVIRSSVSPDYTLIDTFYPTFYKPTIIQQAGSSFALDSTGSYVLITKSADGIEYFGVSQSQLGNLFHTLMLEKQENLWDKVADIGQALGPAFLNVTDYIIGCKWIPFPLQGGTGKQITLGAWDSGIYAIKYSEVLEIQNTSQSFSLTKFTGTKEFMNSSSFYRVTVYIPGCGETPIDIAKCGANVTVNYKIDCLGNILCTISSGGNNLTRVSGSLGREVPLSASVGVASGVSKIGAGVGALITAGVGVATGGIGVAAAAGLAGGGLASIGSGAQTMVADVATKGSIDSYAIGPSSLQMFLTEYKYDIPTQNGTINGYPCMKTLTLSSDGFYQCKDPQVDFGEDLYIKDKIIEYMQGGFYIE